MLVTAALTYVVSNLTPPLTIDDVTNSAGLLQLVDVPPGNIPLAEVKALGGTGALKVGADFLKHVSPGAQVLMRDATVLQALASAGGLTLRGTQRGIKIHRRDEATGEVKIIEPNMNDKLMPNDIIYVKESLF